MERLGSHVQVNAGRLEAKRRKLPFRAVNRRDDPGYQAGVQRHHLLPRQLVSRKCFGKLFETVGRERIGFDDFRSNGLLLPCKDKAALRMGLPLHRGPHRDYNAMVAERVGQIDLAWSRLNLRYPDRAREDALMRLALLQRALRRRLMEQDGKRLRLNRRDPLGRGQDFADLDAMAEFLWAGSGAAARS